jgi:hypothetical protein
VPWGEQAITIPPEGTNAKAMEEAFFLTMTQAKVYRSD